MIWTKPPGNYGTHVNLQGLYPKQLHPGKLTCPLKRDYFNRKYIFQPLFFRGNSLVFTGCRVPVLFHWNPQVVTVQTLDSWRLASLEPVPSAKQGFGLVALTPNAKKTQANPRPNGIIFHQPREIPEIRGFSLTKPPFGGPKLVWGRYEIWPDRIIPNLLFLVVPGSKLATCFLKGRWVSETPIFQ